MGCGASDYAYHSDELTDALKKTGLYLDKKYGSIDVYSQDADTVIECARRNMTMRETIMELYLTRYQRQAIANFNEEMKERELLSQLKDKY